MKRGLSQASTFPSKRMATTYDIHKGDIPLPKCSSEDADLYNKIKVIKLRAIKFERKAALAEQKNKTLQAQLEKIILQNKVLRAGLGARFLLPETSTKVKRTEREDSPCTSQGEASKRFPWLAPKSFILPHTVMERITKCLSDDDLFRFREVSILFYTAYYEQAVTCTKFPTADAFEFQYKGATFNALRALRLALHGRRYPNVEYLDAHQENMSSELIMTISQYNFPSLCVLSLEFRSGSLKGLPGNPKLIALRVSVTQENDGDYLNEVKFPKLRQLRALNKSDDPKVKIGPHRAIEYMELYCSVDWQRMLIGKENFPELKFLESEFSVPTMLKSRLRNEGVELVISS